MQKFWSSLAVQLGKRAGLVSVIGLLVTVALGFGITQLKFATGTDSYLNKDEAIYKESTRYQDRFGGEANLSVITMDPGHTVDELVSNPANKRAIEAVSAEMRKVDQVRAVVDPVVAVTLSHNLLTRNPAHPEVDLPATLPNLLGSIATTSLNATVADGSPISAADLAARKADIQATTTNVLKIVNDSDRVVGNAQWDKVLLYDNAGQVRTAQRPIFPDERHALIITRFTGLKDVDKAAIATNKTFDLVSKLHLEGASVRTTGAPKLLVEINDYLRGGMLTLAGIAIGIMVLILLVLFDVRWRLLPLGVILVGCVWAFGAAGYLHIPLTLVTVAGLPVMLGIGIDYAIQMHARVEEEAIIDRSEHPIQETARNLCPALLVVTFDAVFAFAALHWAKVPMLRDFGLLLAVGVAVICLASIIIPLATLGIREFRSPTRGGDFSEGFLGRLVVKMGGLPAAAAIPLVIASLAIFVGGVSVEKKLHIETDPVKWINPDSQLIKNLHYAEREVKGSSELGVFFEGQVPSAPAAFFSQPLVDHVDDFTNTFRADHPADLPVASSIVEIMSDLLVVPNTARVHPRADLVYAGYAASPRDIQLSDFSPGGDGKPALNVVFLSGPGSLEHRAVIVDEMKKFEGDAAKLPSTVTRTPSGLVVVGVGLLHNLESNRILLTYLAIAFVGAFLTIRMRSIIRALLSLVPVLIAVGAASLVAYALDLKLSPMTAVGGPLVIAACTEFTSLILLRFVEERGRGLEPREAIDVAAARTGRAFIVSALTAIAGVAVISFSSMPLLANFGRIVGMNVAVALVSALVVLPPMLVWADKRNWVSRGMIKPHEPFIETPPMGGAATVEA